MEELSRKRNQPAPPHVIYQALTQPNRDRTRPWLFVQDGELTPTIVKTEEPNLVVWSSLWSDRPDATIRFELPRDDTGQGTDLIWTLELDEPLPDRTRLTEMRKRINLLINGNLRDTFDQ